jgi:hypothetical protein
MITVYSQQTDLVVKHKDLIVLLKWDDSPCTKLVQAVKCELNQGVLDENGEIKPFTANIYVDDILGASAFKETINKLLVAIIESIFLVCGEPDIAVRECPLSLEKWHKLIAGPRQIILGFVVDTNIMTVSITDAYLQQVHKLLSNWDSKNCLFKVREMHKLVSKLVRLGKGAPWIYKLMSHLYTSLAHTLKHNKNLLESCSKNLETLSAKSSRSSSLASKPTCNKM